MLVSEPLLCATLFAASGCNVHGSWRPEQGALKSLERPFVNMVDYSDL